MGTMASRWTVIGTPQVPSQVQGRMHARTRARARTHPTWLPMCSKSRKPELTTSAQRSPLRSSSALVATWRGRRVGVRARVPGAPGASAGGTRGTCSRLVAGARGTARGPGYRPPRPPRAALPARLGPGRRPPLPPPSPPARLPAHRGAHADAGYARGVQGHASRVGHARRRLQQAADALAGCVGIVPWILTQQLEHALLPPPLPVCELGVHIRERAAAVDGEGEVAGRHWGGYQRCRRGRAPAAAAAVRCGLCAASQPSAALGLRFYSA